MKSSIFRLPENMTPQARSATNIILFTLSAGFLTIGISIFRFIKGNGNMPILIFAVAATIANLVSLWLCRRNQHIAGVIISLASIWLLFITSALTNAGTGLAGGVIGILVTILAVAQTMPIKTGARLVILSIVMGVIALVLDLYGPISRPQTTILPQILFIGAILLIANGYFVFQQLRNYSLRTKLTIVFLAVTIIPLAIISITTYNSSRTALTNDASQKLTFAAEQAAAEFDAFINFNLESVRSAGQYPAVVDYFSVPVNQRADSEQESRLLKFITAVSRQDPVFISSVAVFDTKGIDLIDTNPDDIGVDKSSRAYFQKTVQSGLPYVSDVEFSATSGVPSIYFAAPAHDATGKVIGIIRIRYTASILQKFIIADTGLAGNSSYAVLLDKNHVRLAHGTDRNRVFKSVVPLDKLLVAQLQSQGLLPAGTPDENATNLPSFENGLNNVTQSPVFASDTNGDGLLEQAAVAPLATKDWSVAFIQSQSVFLAPITTQTNNNLLTTFAVALAVGVAGFLFSQTLAGPIIRLTQTAEKIADGDINIQAQVETGDEIGTLATTFNRMTQQLRDFIATLEERVVARTKDLETVAEVGTATATILDTNQLLQAVVDLTKERFNLYHSHIYLLDETGENLVLARGAGEAGRQMKEKGLSIPLKREQSLVARAARERQGITVNDVTKAPDFLPNPLLPNTRSELAVPMIVGGNVIGVFDIQSDQVGRFTNSDINIQTTLAAQVSTSIQNVRSFEQSKAQADLETLVNTIGQKIQRTTTVEDTLQTAIREIGLALGASRVSAGIGTNHVKNDRESNLN